MNQPASQAVIISYSTIKTDSKDAVTVVLHNRNLLLSFSPHTNRPFVLLVLFLYIKTNIKLTDLSLLTQMNIVSGHMRSNPEAATKIWRGLVTNI